MCGGNHSQGDHPVAVYSSSVRMIIERNPTAMKCSGCDKKRTKEVISATDKNAVMMTPYHTYGEEEFIDQKGVRICQEQLKNYRNCRTSSQSL
jgi:hypothetical protein